MNQVLRKSALITGVTGQDGATWLSCCSLRATSCTASSGDLRLSTPAASIISIMIRTKPAFHFILHYGDVTDTTNLIRVIQETQPDEIYNLAAQIHVQVSFETPEYTANADAIGALRLLEAIRILGSKRGPFLPGFNLRALRQRPGDAADRDDSFLSRARLTRWQNFTLTGSP